MEIEGQQTMLEEARNRADRAVERVSAHADPDALDYWFGVVWALSRREPEFSTNAVIEYGAEHASARETGSAPGFDHRLVEPRALGVVMRRAQKAGVIRPTDRYEPDRTPRAHARPKRIWRSLIYRVPV